MKIEHTEVFGWKGAIRGMRAPMNSWYKSDSKYYTDGRFKIGESDNDLASKLIKAGPEHCKFLRAIHVQVFFTLPRYIWTELDTYKVATTRLSCSTMHKLGTKDLVNSDFQDGIVLIEHLSWLNHLIKCYIENNKSTVFLREIKMMLPEGFLQSAEYDCNYQTLMLIYHQRKNHRMPEWSGENGICEWIESLPMMKEWLHLKDK